jgi:UDP-glucose 4-epimerase
MPGDELSRSRILVTGASGFIGSQLCFRLCNLGHEVHAVSRLRRPNVENGPQWWAGDLAELAVARRILVATKPEIIVHLAGYPVGARDVSHVIPSFQSNLVSTVNILTAATEVGCRRIILTGSMEEPGPGTLQASPGSPYAAAKRAASTYGLMFHALYGLPVVMLRVFMVYGPKQRDVSKLIPYVTLSLLRGEAPELTSGRRGVDWIYIDDVVEAYVAAMKASNVDGETIDIGSGKMVTIRAVVEQLNRLVNPDLKPVFGAIKDRAFEQERVADAARSTALIGWRPTTSLEQGLQNTVDWYRKQAGGSFDANRLSLK